MSDFVAHNNDLTQAAIEYVRKFEEVAGHEPRFSIHFEGFGSGGTTGVTADDAVRHLRDLAAADDPHYRYSTKIKSIEIAVRYGAFVLS